MISASGIRGIVGDSLSLDLVSKISQSFASFCGNQSIIVGGDTRSSYHAYANTVIGAVLSMGCDVIDIGQCPTPTCQQMVTHFNAAGAIAITASHNPAEWNGIKLIDEHASFLTPNTFKKFYQFHETHTPSLADHQNIGSYQKIHNAIDIHINRILKTIDVSCLKNTNLKVLVDVNHGTGALATPKLLDCLGIAYDLIGPEADGKFEHIPEPTAENLSQLQEQLKSRNYDIGFAQDPDADRLVIVAENGDFIGEDYSLAYCLDYILTELADPDPKDLAVNLSTSRVIDDIANKHQATLHRTAIGEPFVTQKIRDLNAIAGGEGNGGVIFPAVGWGRDSLTGIVLALCHLAKSKKTVSESIQAYPQWKMCRAKQALESKEVIPAILEQVAKSFPDAKANWEDGLKLDFEASWVHIRPSNTEPILRIFAEAQSETAAKSLAETIQNKINQAL